MAGTFTLAEHWNDLRRIALSLGMKMPPDDFELVRRFFYAGAAAMYSIAMDIAAVDDENQCERLMEAVNQELHDMQAVCRADSLTKAAAAGRPRES